MLSFCNTVKLAYNNFGFCDTWSVASNFVLPVSVVGLNDISFITQIESLSWYYNKVRLHFCVFQGSVVLLRWMYLPTCSGKNCFLYLCQSWRKCFSIKNGKSRNLVSLHWEPLQKVYIFGFNPLEHTAGCQTVETSMSFACNSSFLSVDGMTCLIPFESWRKTLSNTCRLYRSLGYKSILNTHDF